MLFTEFSSLLIICSRQQKFPHSSPLIMFSALYCYFFPVILFPVLSVSLLSTIPPLPAKKAGIGARQKPCMDKAQCSGKCCLKNEVRQIQVLPSHLIKITNSNHHSPNHSIHAVFLKGPKRHLTAYPVRTATKLTSVAFREAWK